MWKIALNEDEDTPLTPPPSDKIHSYSEINIFINRYIGLHCLIFAGYILTHIK